MSLAGAILRKLVPPDAPAPKAVKPSANSTTYRYAVNISPRRTWLMRMNAALVLLRPRSKNDQGTAVTAQSPETEGKKAPSKKEIEEFSRFLSRDQNDPLVVLWLNDARVRQREHGGSLRNHLFALWRERTAHAAGIAASLKAKPKIWVGELTRDARVYLGVFSLVVYAFFYMLAVSEPAFITEVVLIGVFTNLALIAVYGLRFHLGRGPSATGNPLVWIFGQLGFPLFAGGAAGIVLAALVMNMSSEYASITNDGTGGIFTLIRIFWADFVGHTHQ